jgi:hypothetical protein
MTRASEEDVAVSADPFPKIAVTRSKSNNPTKPQFKPPTIRRRRVIIFNVRMQMLHSVFTPKPELGLSVPIKNKKALRAIRVHIEIPVIPIDICPLAFAWKNNRRRCHVADLPDQ